MSAPFPAHRVRKAGAAIFILRRGSIRDLAWTKGSGFTDKLSTRRFAYGGFGAEFRCRVLVAQAAKA
jgi:hypothetical protein